MPFSKRNFSSFDNIQYVRYLCTYFWMFSSFFFFSLFCCCKAKKKWNACVYVKKMVMSNRPSHSQITILRRSSTSAVAIPHSQGIVCLFIMSIFHRFVENHIPKMKSLGRFLYQISRIRVVTRELESNIRKGYFLCFF